MRALSVSVIPLVVCDDSNMARKQVLRALPADWPVSITEASHGRQAMDAIRQGLGQVVLLDLTMPEMDGYQVLSALRAEGLKAQVIVISGDIQEEAVRRVHELGALAFLKKPFDENELRQTLSRLGLLNGPGLVSSQNRSAANTAINFHDAFRETVNVAIGRAAALIARVLGVFVQLPVPNVNILEVGELHMALADAGSSQQLTAICQGFIGSGIAGEALLIFHDSEIADIAQLMQRQSADYSDLEMLLDLSSVLIGACLSSIAEQIDVVFSQGHPQVLGQHAAIEELIRVNRTHWKKTLAVEISYGLEGHDIRFDLLLLFTEDSIERLTHKLAYLMS
ncbi:MULTISPECIES: response regulator [Pseudomonas]|uniref:response regulator n=2 Tax=Pseudomonas TaxID=286 RepID=UPI000877059B|nr:MULTISPECIES: response regulator [Pseudomonas]NHN68109.1 response regulator [Pseudomonas fluorescens]ROO34870.1 chemotaxis protein CheC [Pseudomonas sp. 7SR1]ROO42300.1 chemotaxis protein CheC [Pseudomonas sp. AF76]SCX70651.1 Response regulator containing CheY-like receiver, AAA-type ATPase, and DNA-binding domains [Pseudomonas sp. NFACC32-1]SFW85165.1 Response regulator containing CheY-like receiver, AAA-type ATPase, and DNA-binding domains [Pseudomonas sp. NFACC09-4]